MTGEEGYAAIGRHGFIVGNRCENFEAWKAVAAIGGSIAIGTLLSRPPSFSKTLAVEGTNYWYYDNAYYSRVYSGGSVAYQVVPPPAGAIIPVLPRDCVPLALVMLAIRISVVPTTSPFRRVTRSWSLDKSHLTNRMKRDDETNENRTPTIFVRFLFYWLYTCRYFS